MVIGGFIAANWLQQPGPYRLGRKRYRNFRIWVFKIPERIIFKEFMRCPASIPFTCMALLDLF